MLNLFKFVFVLAVVAGIAGYFLGWFDLNVGINGKKIKDDLKGAGVDGLVGPIGDDGNAAAPKDDKGTAPGKDDRGSSSGKEDRTPGGKSDGPKKDRVVTGKDDKNSPSVKEERAEGIVADIAKDIPRFTVRLIDSGTMKLDNRYLTFDMAPKGEIRLNEVLSDFRAVRVGRKVVVAFYQEADPTSTGPPKNMARTILIERGK